MAVYRGPLRRLLRRRSRSLFATELAKPGFNPDDVRADVAGWVEHGPAATDPECRGHGVVALLVGRQLGWVAPVAAARRASDDDPVALPDRLDGWVPASWVMAWSLAAGELTVEYTPPRGRSVRGAGGSMVLRIAGEPTALNAFVRRAGRVLRRASRR